MVDMHRLHAAARLAGEAGVRADDAGLAMRELDWACQELRASLAREQASFAHEQTLRKQNEALRDGCQVGLAHARSLRMDTQEDEELRERIIQTIELALTADAALGRGGEGEQVTHGRHCTCSACAREDWTRPGLGDCGMHGPGCPAVYAPIGRGGEPDGS